MPTPDNTGPAAGPATSAKPAVQSAIPNPQSPIARLLAYRRLWLLAGLIAGLDQLTKYWIIQRLPFGSYGPGASIEVFPNFFYLVHVGNTGAAWSMFTGMSVLLAVLAGATLLAIYLWRRQLGLRQPAAQLAFGLLCGGITGNLADRILHGHVIDFLDLHFGSYIYPTFNVADSAICVGVIGYVLWSLKQPPTVGSEK